MVGTIVTGDIIEGKRCKYSDLSLLAFSLHLLLAKLNWRKEKL
jgi:hypothetical protein